MNKGATNPLWSRLETDNALKNANEFISAPKTEHKRKRKRCYFFKSFRIASAIVFSSRICYGLNSTSVAFVEVRNVLTLKGAAGRESSFSIAGKMLEETAFGFSKTHLWNWLLTSARPWNCAKNCDAVIYDHLIGSDCNQMLVALNSCEMWLTSHDWDFWSYDWRFSNQNYFRWRDCKFA